MLGLKYKVECTPAANSAASSADPSSASMEYDRPLIWSRRPSFGRLPTELTFESAGATTRPAPRAIGRAPSRRRRVKK